MERTTSDSVEPRIMIVGVGGGGCNAVERMIEADIQGVEFVAINTEAGALAKSSAAVRLRIGPTVCMGRGAGGDPTRGQKAAQESIEEVAEVLGKPHMVFVTAGMGGGTGTGAAPTVAKVARDAGALTVGVVTKPFSFEGSLKLRTAQDGIGKLSKEVDTLIAIPNDRLLQILGQDTTLREAFAYADEVLRQGVQGISDVITQTGLVNVDFHDVKAIMTNGGTALMSIGYAEGERRAIEAASMAVNSQLLDLSIDGATGVLFNIRGGDGMGLLEVNAAGEIIRQMADPDANIIFGAAIDESMDNAIQITLIATGFDAEPGRSATTAHRGLQRELVHGGERPSEAISLSPTAFAREETEIPAFLRRNG